LLIACAPIVIVVLRVKQFSLSKGKCQLVGFDDRGSTIRSISLSFHQTARVERNDSVLLDGPKIISGE
jgi:hypothetical protein